jgi:hypothetical protein
MDMRRRSIVDFEVNLAKQIETEKAALASLEADVVARRVKIETLEGVQTTLKANGAEGGDEVAEAK